MKNLLICVCALFTLSLLAQNPPAKKVKKVQSFKMNDSIYMIVNNKDTTYWIRKKDPIMRTILIRNIDKPKTKKKK